MKLMTFRHDGAIAAGYLDREEVVICAQGAGADRALLDLVVEGEASLSRWAALADAPRVPLSAVTVLAPFPSPGATSSASERTTTPMPPNSIPAASIPAARKQSRVRR